MKRIICGTEYNTDLSAIVKKVTHSYYGDPAGYEETLYVTEGGKYFLYTNGGAESKYKTEKIVRKSKKTADEFVSTH